MNKENLSLKTKNEIQHSYKHECKTMRRWKKKDMDISLRPSIDATVEGSSPPCNPSGAGEHIKAKLPLTVMLQLNWSRYFETSFKLQRLALKVPCKISLFR